MLVASSIIVIKHHNKKAEIEETENTNEKVLIDVKEVDNYEDTLEKAEDKTNSSSDSNSNYTGTTS